MYDRIVAIKLESLRSKQARLKELFQRGQATNTELLAVKKEMEDLQWGAAKETSAQIKAEANHTAAEQNIFSDPKNPKTWIK